MFFKVAVTMHVCSGLALLNQQIDQAHHGLTRQPTTSPIITVGKAVAHDAASMLTLASQREYDQLASAYSLSLIVRDYGLLPCAY